MANCTFEQVITENTCQWPVETHWCGKSLHKASPWPYCEEHFWRSLNKRTDHAELVEAIQTKQNPQARHGLNRKGAQHKSGFGFMAHAGGGE